MTTKILDIHGSTDCCSDGDWVLGEAAKEFIDGGYTHVRDLDDGGVFKAARYPTQCFGSDDLVMLEGMIEEEL